MTMERSMRLVDPFLAATLASGLILTTGVAPRAATFTVNQWPQDIGKVPCEAWKKNPDGSWAQASPIQAGTLSITGKSFVAGSGEGRMLDAKCPGR
jgi:hypothetical protein